MTSSDRSNAVRSSSASAPGLLVEAGELGEPPDVVELVLQHPEPGIARGGEGRPELDRAVELVDRRLPGAVEHALLRAKEVLRGRLRAIAAGVRGVGAVRLASLRDLGARRRSPRAPFAPEAPAAADQHQERAAPDQQAGSAALAQPQRLAEEVEGDREEGEGLQHGGHGLVRPDRALVVRIPERHRQEELGLADRGDGQVPGHRSLVERGRVVEAPGRIVEEPVEGREGLVEGAELVAPDVDHHPGAGARRAQVRGHELAAGDGDGLARPGLCELRRRLEHANPARRPLQGFPGEVALVLERLVGGLALRHRRPAVPVVGEGAQQRGGRDQQDDAPRERAGGVAREDEAGVRANAGLLGLDGARHRRRRERRRPRYTTITRRASTRSRTACSSQDAPTVTSIVPAVSAPTSTPRRRRRAASGRWPFRPA